ncbi:ABC transporter substrate-binding protein [Nonomuraea rhizosphaerae]|uniref:ABC transporter substrate-binding protein n=1 Tax=Nonomuraea rhizosphaerae TaxID=2665663 RepID=UPI001C607237|nr:ABC transporter substrate-binding protein [Nonomuraea rhizosphaerae]
MALWHKNRRGTITGALALTAAFALSACGSSTPADTGASASASASGSAPAAAGGVQLVSPGKLVTCTNLPYPPFQAKDASGKVVGFDVEMIDLVAKKLGVTQEIVDIDFDAIKGGAALSAGKCDVAAAGMTITEERKAHLDFSDPYFDEVLGLVTKKGAGVATLDDAKSKNLSVGVQAGTTSLDLAKGKGIEAKEFKDSGKLLLALQSGQVDMVVQDLPVVVEWMKKPNISSAFELSGQVPTKAQYGFAVKKGNAALLKAVNESLAGAISDGTWTKSYQQWMGAAPVSTPKPTS